MMSHIRVSPHLGLCGTGVGGGRGELALRIDVDDQKSAISFLQKLQQHHCALILTSHLRPLIIFLYSNIFGPYSVPCVRLRFLNSEIWDPKFSVWPLSNPSS